MRRRTVWILLAGIAVGIAWSEFLHHPAPGDEPDRAQILDGARTYVDNDALWRVISGDWVSADGRWMLILGGEDRMTLLWDGKTVAKSALRFSYLCPEPPQETAFTAENPRLCGIGGEIVSFIHEAGTESGTLILELLNTDEKTETVTFQKRNEQEDNDGTI